MRIKRGMVQLTETAAVIPGWRKGLPCTPGKGEKVIARFHSG